jgi:hypothetical protein
MSGHIDWTTELKKIEREFSGLPPEPSAEQQRAKRAAEQRERERTSQKALAIGAWVRLVVVAALAAGLPFWPYPHACGVGLFGYMAVATVIIAGGLWVAAWTWRGRLARAHGLAMLVVLWGLIVLASVVLPRVGYARVDPATETAAGWRCG